MRKTLLALIAAYRVAWVFGASGQCEPEWWKGLDVSITCKACETRLFWEDAAKAKQRLGELEMLAMEVRIGSAEEQVVVKQIQFWSVMTERFVGASKEWEKALRSSSSGDWNTALRSAQQSLGILSPSTIILDEVTSRKVASINCLRAVALEKLQDKERALHQIAVLLKDQSLATPFWKDDLGTEIFLRYKAGSLALSLQLAETAVYHFKEMLKLCENSMEAHRGLGQSVELTLMNSIPGAPMIPAHFLNRAADQHPFFSVDSNVPSLARDIPGYDEKMETILMHYKTAIRLGCDDPYVYVRVGTILGEREEWDSASQFLRKAVGMWPESAQAHLVLGRILRARGYILRKYGKSSDSGLADRMIGEAVSNFQQASWLNDMNLNAHLELADTLLREGRLDESLTQATRGVEIDPDHVPARTLLANVLSLKAMHRESIKQLNIAIESARRQVVTGGANNSFGNSRALALAHLYKLAGKAYLELGEPDVATGLIESARAIFDQARDESGLLDAQLVLGQVKLAKRQWVGAADTFRVILESNSVPEAHIGYADAIMEMKDGRLKALEHYQAAIDLGTSELRVFKTSVALLLRNSTNIMDGQRAKHILEVGVTRWPKSAELLYELGKVTFRLDPDKSGGEISLFRRAAAANPQCASCHLELGKALSNHGKFQKAIEALTNAFKLDKRNPEILYFMGVVLTKLNRLDGALRSFDEANELVLEYPSAVNPQSGSYSENHLTLKQVGVLARIGASNVHLLLGEIDLAIESLVKAVEMDPAAIEARESLALILSAQGNIAAAQEHHQMAQRLSSVQRGVTTIQLPVSPHESIPALSSSEKHEDSSAVPVSALNDFTSLGKTNASSSIRSAHLCSKLLSENLVALPGHMVVPGEPGSVLQIAGMFASQGQNIEAAECFEVVVRSHHKVFGPEALFQWGKLIRSTEPSRSNDMILEAAKQIPPEHPRHLEVLLWTAKSLSHDADAGQRLNLIMEAVNTHPHSAAAFHALGVELEGRNELLRSEEAFREASMIMDTNSSLVASDTFFRLAKFQLQKRNGEWEDQAMQLLELAQSRWQGVNKTKACREGQHNGIDHSIFCSSEDLWSPRFSSEAVLRMAVSTELGSLYLGKKRVQEASDQFVQTTIAAKATGKCGTGDGFRLILARSICSLGQIFHADKQLQLSTLFLRACVLIAPQPTQSNVVDFVDVLRAVDSFSRIAKENDFATSDRALIASRLATIAIQLQSGANKLVADLLGFVTSAVALLADSGFIEEAMQLIRRYLVVVEDSPTLKKESIRLLTEKAKIDESYRNIGAWASELERPGLDFLEQKLESLERGSRVVVLAKLLAEAAAKGCQGVLAESCALVESFVSNHMEQDLQLSKNAVFAVSWGDFGRARGWARNKTAQIYANGLGSEFQLSFDFQLEAKMQSHMLQANLLVIPSLFSLCSQQDRNSSDNFRFDPAFNALHSRLAEERSVNGNQLLSMVHTWWALNRHSDQQTYFAAGTKALTFGLVQSPGSSSRTAILEIAVRHFEDSLGQSDKNLKQSVCGLGLALASLGKAHYVMNLFGETSQNSTCLCELASVGEAFFVSNQMNSAMAVWSRLLPLLEIDSSCSVSSDEVEGDCSLLIGEPLVHFAGVLEKSGNFKEAIRVLSVVSESYLSHIPSTPKWQILHVYGSLLFHQGHYESAVQILTRAVNENSENVGTRNNLGAALYRLGRLREAVAVLNAVLPLCDLLHPSVVENEVRVVTQDNSNCKAAARLNLALAHEDLGDFEAASHHVGAVLKTPSSTEVAGTNRVALQRQLARLLKARGKVAAAVELLRDTVRSLQLELQQIETSEEINRIETSPQTQGPIQTGSHMKRAESFVRLDLADTLKDLGISYGEAGQHFESVRLLRRVLLMKVVDNFDAESDTVNNVIDVYGPTLWDYLDTLPTKKIELRLKFPGPLMDLGNAYFRAGDFGQARNLYEFCVSLFPSESNAWNNLGVVAFQEGQWKRSVECFQRAVELNPKNTDAKLALEHVSSDGPAPWMLQILPAENHPSPFQQGTLVG